MANKETSKWQAFLAWCNKWIVTPAKYVWGKFWSIFNTLNKLALLIVLSFFGLQWHAANISLVNTASFALTVFVALVLYRNIRKDSKNNVANQPEGKTKK